MQVVDPAAHHGCGERGADALGVDGIVVVLSEWVSWVRLRGMDSCLRRSGRRSCAVDRQACKPSSVSRRTAGRRSSIWDAGCPAPLAANPRTGRAPIVLLFGLAPGGVCRAPGVATGAVSSCLTGSPLPRKRGGMFSVALSVGFPRLAVSQHPARWSSDFPP